MKKRFYTWQKFDKDVEKIAVWARTKNFKNIYGIPRGGLMVAVVLSHRLDLPLVMRLEEVNKDTLVVDDISDSGETLLRLEKELGWKPAASSLFYHNDTKRRPDFAPREKKEWVVFPWETEESSKRDHHNL